MIDYATAKELAQRVADSEGGPLDSHDSWLIVDASSAEYPWGWVFEPVIEPYYPTRQFCPYTGA